VVNKKEQLEKGWRRRRKKEEFFDERRPASQKKNIRFYFLLKQNGLLNTLCTCVHRNLKPGTVLNVERWLLSNTRKYLGGGLLARLGFTEVCASFSKGPNIIYPQFFFRKLEKNESDARLKFDTK
jgi:hypothetical protein